jgi:hypothetical protein
VAATSEIPTIIAPSFQPICAARVMSNHPIEPQTLVTSHRRMNCITKQPVAGYAGAVPRDAGSYGFKVLGYLAAKLARRFGIDEKNAEQARRLNHLEGLPIV